MSCNGCRVLRKGCSEKCILRPCLQWIDGAEAQGHATVFVAKFFGRAGLMSFISAVPETQRPSLFQSLLFEAAGRTVNPVNGVVGLLGSGNLHICQEAVETVLRGGSLRPIQGFVTAVPPEHDEVSEVCADMYKLANPSFTSRPKLQQQQQQQQKRRSFAGLDLSLTSDFPVKTSRSPPPEKRRRWSPSMNSEESVTSMCFESRIGGHHPGQAVEPKLLDLFD